MLGIIVSNYHGLVLVENDLHRLHVRLKQTPSESHLQNSTRHTSLLWGSLRASAANTPTAITPEDVSHSLGRNFEGRNPENGRRRDFGRRGRRQSGFLYIYGPRSSSPELCNENHNGGRESLMLGFYNVRYEIHKFM